MKSVLKSHPITDEPEELDSTINDIVHGRLPTDSELKRQLSPTRWVIRAKNSDS